MTSSASSSAFAGFRFPREVIAVAVRWHLRYGLSYRDVEELLAERGITVDHVTIYRSVQRFTGRIHRSRPPGQRRDLAASWRLFTRALRAGTVPAEVTTDRAPAYPQVRDELVPSALNTVEQYANNPIEADHRRLKARLRPMRGLKRDRSARIVAAGHAFVQNLRRGHYDIATDVLDRCNLRAIFDELAPAI